MLDQSSALQSKPDCSRRNTKVTANFCEADVVFSHLKRLINIPRWLLVLALVFGGYSSHAKGLEYRLHADAVMICDGLKRPTLCAQLGPFIDGPFLGSHQVMPLVVSGVHDFQVVNAVIESIPVLVMDVLTAKQLAPKVLLHHVSVFENLFALSSNFDSDVAIKSETLETSDMSALVWSSHDFEIKLKTSL